MANILQLDQKNRGKKTKNPQCHSPMQSIKSEIEMQCVLSTFNRDNKSLRPLCIDRANAENVETVGEKNILLLKQRTKMNVCGKIAQIQINRYMNIANARPFSTFEWLIFWGQLFQHGSNARDHLIATFQTTDFCYFFHF